MKYESGGVSGQLGQALVVEVPIAAPPANGIDITVKDGSGKAASGLAWQLTLPGGEVKSGSTGSDGKITVPGVPAGDCQLVFPDLDKSGAAAGKAADGGGAPVPAPSNGGATGDAPESVAPTDDKPVPKDAAGKRQAIIDKAREYLGKIDPRAG